ncbi:MAG TPA: porin [Rhizobacter sp.]|nr:porin [Rhizobacter sp.]
MKRSAFAAAALATLAGAAHAQSSVTIYGVMDAALRFSNHQGATGGERLATLISSGLTPSRIGFDVSEDLGGGLRALANMEHRLTLDNGMSEPGGQFWQQSWVGLHSNTLGRITLGRQANVLYDAAVGFAAFKTVGPFINSYKPEIAVAMGARNDNMAKYALTVGGLAIELEAAAGEGAAATTTVGKALGGMARYATGPVTLGGGYLEREDAAQLKAKGYVAGVAYQSGPLYLNASFIRNEFDDGFNSAVLLVGSGVENIVAPNQPGLSPAVAAVRAKQRTVWTAGGTYALAPAFTLGAQYWNLSQDYHVAGTKEASGDFVAVLGDYALSRRTHLYGAIEHSRVENAELTNIPTGIANGEDSRSAVMLGIRHNF